MPPKKIVSKKSKEKVVYKVGKQLGRVQDGGQAKSLQEAKRKANNYKAKGASGARVVQTETVTKTMVPKTTKTTKSVTAKMPKTKRISPKQISSFKNQITAEASKATLKAVRENTIGTGARSVQVGVPNITVKKNINKPKIKVTKGQLALRPRKSGVNLKGKNK
jgi:hypothetical protein